MEKELPPVVTLVPEEQRKDINWMQIMDFVRHGAMGNLVEVESADGDSVRIFVE